MIHYGIGAGLGGIAAYGMFHDMTLAVCSAVFGFTVLAVHHVWTHGVKK